MDVKTGGILWLTILLLAGCGSDPTTTTTNTTNTTTRHTVTPSAGANGKLTPSEPQTVKDGQTIAFGVIPNEGYGIGQVDGCDGSLEGDVFTSGPITSNCAVTASFELLQPPPAPSLSLTPQAIKTFAFNWDDVSGETEYRLLEDPDGTSGFSQVATIAADATSHEIQVYLPGRVNARYVLEACNDAGCSESNAVAVMGNLAAAVGYVKASNTDSEDWFGLRVVLSRDGNTMAVAAPYEDGNATGQTDNNAPNSGAVYVFSYNGTTWSQTAYLKASNTGEEHQFGYSVAIASDGNTLAVGAIGEPSNATGVGGDQTNNTAPNRGAVYVFGRSNTTWSQLAYVKASNTEENDRFGFSVALANDGNILAVGASYEDSGATGVNGDQADNTTRHSGAVYVFNRAGATWSQKAYLKASNSGEGDFFGNSVALAGDGNTLAVGAWQEDSSSSGVNGVQTDNTSASSGAVYVFARDGAFWSQQAYLKASRPWHSNHFGRSVALSGDGNTLAVGAYGESSGSTGINGSETGNAATSSGAVYAFIRSGVSWTQQAYIKASNMSSYFGHTVALTSDGNTLAVGAFNESGGATGIDGDQTDRSAGSSGAVYVFSRNGGIWWQQSYVKASNTEARDYFGYSVALSADGRTLAVGARTERSSARGLGGDQSDNSKPESGAVYLY